MDVLDNRQKSNVLNAIKHSKSTVVQKLAKRKLNYLETFELAQLLGMIAAIAVGATYGYHSWQERVGICNVHWGNKNAEFISQNGIAWPNLEYDLGDCVSHANNNGLSEFFSIALLFWIPSTFLGVWVHKKVVDHSYKAFINYFEDELEELGQDYAFVLAEPSLERRFEMLEDMEYKQ
jgi:hypothetical protein